jgi:uridine kinase
MGKDFVKVRVRTDPRAPFLEAEIPKGATLAGLAALYQSASPYRFLAAKVGCRVRELGEAVDSPSEVTLLDMRDNAAWLIYQRSLSLLYLKAVEDVLGRREVTIGNSLSKGLFTVIKAPALTDGDVEAVEARMRELAAADVPIVKERVSRAEAYELLKADGHREKIRVLEAADRDLTEVAFYSMDGFRNYFYGQMAPSSGYLERFSLKRYRNGVLLLFPHPSDPNALPPFEDEKKRYEAFGEAAQWGKLTGVSTATDLNETIEGGRGLELIQLSEALHEKKIAYIADRISDERKRVILIAGPSSSGKTTFARRLCVQLRVNGLTPLYLGTDDYFLDRADCPLDDYGVPKFEDLAALDLDLFNRDMNALLKGDEVDLPRYDFLSGRKVFGERPSRCKAGQPIVIEGIHGLNGALTASIDDAGKFRIYVSPLTALNIDGQNRVPTTDIRLLRRLIRDSRTRGSGAKQTIAFWPKVREGEDRNIFPYNNAADVLFNSVHIYEIAVLKRHATPLLDGIGENEEEYAEARRLKRLLQFFKAMDDDAVANNSILREFIGGSVFV